MVIYVLAAVECDYTDRVKMVRTIAAYRTEKAANDKLKAIQKSIKEVEEWRCPNYKIWSACSCKNKPKQNTTEDPHFNPDHFVDYDVYETDLLK